MASYGRKRLHRQEYDLARLLGMQYTEALNRKNEWMDLPEFVRGMKSFSIYLASLIDARKAA